ncbi:hypothetical protein [Serratia sp. ser-z]
MSTEKLSELSKPVGFVSKLAQTFLKCGEPASIRPFFDVQGSSPLYSQEYVSALTQRIAELEEQNERLKKELHNEGAANAHAYERIRELEKRLATPVRLPEKYNMKMAGDKSTKSMFYGHNSAINDSAKAIRAAGFTVEGDE